MHHFADDAQPVGARDRDVVEVDIQARRIPPIVGGAEALAAAQHADPQPGLLADRDVGGADARVDGRAAHAVEEVVDDVHVFALDVALARPEDGCGREGIAAGGHVRFLGHVHALVTRAAEVGQAVPVGAGERGGPGDPTRQLEDLLQAGLEVGIALVAEPEQLRAAAERVLVDTAGVGLPLRHHAHAQVAVELQALAQVHGPGLRGQPRRDHCDQCADRRLFHVCLRLVVLSGMKSGCRRHRASLSSSGHTWMSRRLRGCLACSRGASGSAAG